MSKVIGIDLGTTNSCVAIMDGSQGEGSKFLHGRRVDARSGFLGIADLYG